MRRALAWTAGIVGIAALARLLRRRPAPVPETPPAADPAEELRRAIAETRAPEPGAAASDDTSVEDRRAEVHARAEETIARMREGDG